MSLRSMVLGLGGLFIALIVGLLVLAGVATDRALSYEFVEDSDD